MLFMLTVVGIILVIVLCVAGGRVLRRRP